MSEPQRFFQFLAGERKGEVLVLDGIVEEDDMIFLEFKDRSRCNEELILPLNERIYTNQLMAEVSGPDNVWRFDEKTVGAQEEKWAKNADGKEVCVQEYNPGKTTITPIPPKRVASNFGTINKHIETPAPQPAAVPQPEARISSGPVWDMMEAAKKFPTPVEVEISIMLPKKTLFEVAEESFEDGGKKVVEYIIENLDISDLKEALRQSLFEAYGHKPSAEPIKKVDQPVRESLPAVEIETPKEDTIEITEDKISPEIPPLPVDDGLPVAEEEPVVGDPLPAQSATK